MKNTDETLLLQLLSKYRICKLRIICSELRALKRGEAIKLYYSLLTNGVRYTVALQDKNERAEATKVLNEMLTYIEKSPVKPDRVTKREPFLKGNVDFGPMEHGVV